LDRECIRFNAAKRGLAKLCLNSMWGKLTERNDRMLTKIITEPKELYGVFAHARLRGDEPRFFRR